VDCQVIAGSILHLPSFCANLNWLWFCVFGFVFDFVFLFSVFLVLNLEKAFSFRVEFIRGNGPS
jgi:hypothetical protein